MTTANLVPALDYSVWRRWLHQSGGTRNSIPVYFSVSHIHRWEDGRLRPILNYDFLMALVLQRKPQLDSKFCIQIDHADAMMTFGADTNVLPRIVLILWVCQVIAENIILHMFIVDRIHELSAVGTVDGRFSLSLRI